jgi:ABC-type transport system involved in multi-copper enzyme maturation permease subunit
MLANAAFSLRVIWACLKKEVKTSLTDRTFTIVGTLVPINILFLMTLFVIGGGYAPTAVVLNDRGPYAQQFYQAMSEAHSFRLQQTSAQDAEVLIQAGRIVAVVTVPADFDARIQANEPVQVGVQINNLNTDFTNDIRRAVPLSITSFYAKAFPNLVTVVPRERDAYAQDTDYVPYLAVSILVVGVMLGGVLQSGIGTAREWESATIKELLLSPASRWAIVVGKMLGALAVGMGSLIVIIAALVLLFGVWPAHWAEVIGFGLLTQVIFVAWGTLLGTLFRNRTPVLALAFGTSIPLFILSGAFGPLSFSTPAVQVIAQLFPVAYAIALQQHAFHNFNLNTYGVEGNALILLAYATGLMLLAALALRRATVAH